MSFFISFTRIALPIIAVIILAKCVLTLLLGHPVNKTYGYIIDAVNGKRLPLNMWETSIGRSNSCDIAIGYDTVSRFQAVISRRIDGWYVFDTRSRSGTRVNGQKIDRRSVIKDGDKLIFGDKLFYFVVSNDPVQQVGNKREKRKTGQPLPPQPPAQGQQQAQDPLLRGQAQYPQQGQRGPLPRANQTNPAAQGVPANLHQEVLAPMADDEKFDLNFDSSQGKQQNQPPLQQADSLNRDKNVLFDVAAPASGAVFSGAYTPEPEEQESAGPQRESEPALIDRDTGAVYVLCGSEVIIGRGRGSDISLNNMTVSRRHAILRLFDDGWAVEDAGSKLGTTLNDRPVRVPQLLFDGDIIGVSEYRLCYISDYSNFAQA